MSVTKISFSIRSILGEEVLRSPRNVNYTSLQRERPNNQSNLLSEEIVIPRSRSPLLHRCDGNRFVNLHASPIRAPQNTIESENIPPHINFPGLPQRFPDIQEQFQMAAIFVQRQAENEFPSSAKFSSHLSHCTHSCCRHRKIIPHGFPRNLPSKSVRHFSDSQILQLERAFRIHHYVVGPSREELAQAINLSEIQVKTWFRNRRAKHRRLQRIEVFKSGKNK